MQLLERNVTVFRDEIVDSHRGHREVWPTKKNFKFTIPVQECSITLCFRKIISDRTNDTVTTDITPRILLS